MTVSQDVSAFVGIALILGYLFTALLLWACSPNELWRDTWRDVRKRGWKELP